MQKYRRIERSYGSCVRTFSLPDVIDEEKVKAEFKEGVLNLSPEVGEGEAESHRREGGVSWSEGHMSGTTARFGGRPLCF